jgi:hypothetical protein
LNSFTRASSSQRSSDIAPQGVDRVLGVCCRVSGVAASPSAFNCRFSRMPPLLLSGVHHSCSIRWCRS